jgi:hypothetical protein
MMDPSNRRAVHYLQKSEFHGFPKADFNCSFVYLWHSHAPLQLSGAYQLQGTADTFCCHISSTKPFIHTYFQESSRVPMLAAQCETGLFCALIGGRGRISEEPWRTFGETAVRHRARPHPRPRPPQTTTTARRGSSVDYFDLGAATDNESVIKNGSNRNRDSTMAENQAAKPAGPNVASGDAAGSSAAGIPFYEKQRQHLKELISRRRALEKKLVRPTRFR